MSENTTLEISKNNQGVLAQMLGMEHEQVIFCNDSATGLKAIIAIHNTTLGPALGGTRMWKYNTEEEALRDVLRLSRGMTYKAAVSGLNLGGGKAVIIGDSRTGKSEALLRRFGKFVNSLSGKYITAEDVGINTKDMEYVYMETKHVTGIPEWLGGSGDPSPVTAFGVYMGMKAGAKKAYGNDSLAGKKVLVQGIGHVGTNLVKHLTKEGAKVYINDIFEDKLKVLSQETNAEIILGDSIFDLDIDIYAPCALGATLNDNTINRLKATVIAGAANNQLEDEQKHGNMILQKGIVYAPDFVINAGGLINVYSELQGFNKEAALLQAENIYNTTLSIFKVSEENKITTHQAAKQLAEERIAQVGRIRISR